jgi:hypothetical protein
MPLYYIVQARSYVWHLTGGDLRSTRFAGDTILDLKCRDGLLVVHSIRLFQCSWTKPLYCVCRVSGRPRHLMRETH